MKRFLTTRLFIFLITSLIAINAAGQALPDPGDDPIDTVDSLSQSIRLKLIPPESHETRATVTDTTSGRKPLIGIDNLSFYNTQENFKSLLKNKVAELLHY